MKKKSRTKATSQPQYRPMTVALIREPGPGSDAEVAFSESARFYRIRRSNPRFKEILRALRQAKAGNQAVKVLVDFPHGDEVKGVEAPG